MEAGRLFKTIYKSLGDDQESAVSALKTPTDAVAIAVHAWALHSGLRYDGFSDDNIDNDNKNKKHDTFELDDIKPLEETWQRGSPNFFSFRYSKNGLPIDLTVSKLGGSVAVHGLLGGKDANWKVEPQSIVNLAFFQRPDGTEEIQDAFTSDTALENFCDNLTSEVLKKLLPPDDSGSKASTPAGASNSGVKGERMTTLPSSQILGEQIAKEEQRQQAKQQPSSLQEEEPKARIGEDYSRGSTPTRPESRPFTPNLSGPPRQHPLQDGPPGFEDEYEMNQPPVATNPSSPFVPYGDQDLYPPMGRNPPLQPFMPGPGLGIGGGGGRGNTGGMHPSFDDPLFQNHDDQQNSGRQGHPDLMRPPGARWDPTGPSDGRFGFGGGGNSSHGGGPSFI